MSMRSLRAVVTMFVVVTTVAAVVAVAPERALAQPSRFADVADGVFYSEAVVELDRAGVLAGTECAEGFCPAGVIDRKTMAVWVVRVLGGQDPPSVSGSRFDDVDAGSFYGPFIERMADLGVTSGCGDGTAFCPDRAVSRAQMAVFMSRVYHLPQAPAPGFDDVPDDAWYAQDVARLAASGITAGCGDGTAFCPSRDTTRAQMATFLWRAENRSRATAEPVLVPTDGSGVSVPAGGAFTAAFDNLIVSAPAGALSAQATVSMSETTIGVSQVIEGEELAAAPIAVGITGAEVARPLEFHVEIDTSSDLSATGVTPAWYSDELQAWVPLNVQDLEIGHGEITFKAILADAEPVAAATVHGPTLHAGFEGPSAALVVPLVVVGILVFAGTTAAVAAVALTSDLIRNTLKGFFGLVAAEPQCDGAPLPPWVTQVSDSDEARSPGDARLHVCGESDGASLLVKVVNNRNFGVELQPSARSQDIEMPGGNNPEGALDIAIKEVAEEIIGGSYLWPLSQSQFTLPVQPGNWNGYLRITGKTTVVDAIRIGLDLLKVALPAIEQANNAQFIGCVRALLEHANDSAFDIASRKEWTRLLQTVAACFDLDAGDADQFGQTAADAFKTVKNALSWLSTIESAATWGLALADAIKDLDEPDAKITVRAGPIKADINAINPTLDGGGIISAGGLCALVGGDITCFWRERQGRRYLASPMPSERFKSITHRAACGVKTNGAIACFNGFQSDDPQFDPQERDARYKDFLGEGCGLKTDGTINCWGNSAEEKEAAVPAGTFKDAQMVSAGLAGCAIRTDETITCWGPPGDWGATTITAGGRWHASESYLDPPSGTFTYLSEGPGTKLCALRTDGTITCWGHSPNGPGFHTYAPSGKFSALSYAGDIACAIRTEGNIECWVVGGSVEALVENSHTATLVVHGAFLDVPPGKFVAVSAASSRGGRACAVRTDGTIICWGDLHWGGSGSLSGRFSSLSPGGSCGIGTDGTVACWGRFTFLPWTAPAGKFTTVVNSYAGGFPFACGLRIDETIACWGQEFRGGDLPVVSDVPSGRFSALSAGAYHACAVRTDGRAVECWGQDFGGEVLDPPTGEFADVSAGERHACGLRIDGTIECWGFVRHRYDWRAADAPAGRFTTVQAGANHACAVRTDDRAVECWGQDFGGEVLDPPTGEFADVSAGERHACGLRIDGTIECWGVEGQHLDAPSGRFIAVSTGGSHSCGLRASGIVECWGQHFSPFFGHRNR